MMKSDIYGGLATLLLIVTAAVEIIGIETNALILITGMTVIVTIDAASERTDEFVRGLRKE